MASPRKNLYLLGFVSLFTDLAGQMIYPLIPAFLVSLGTTPSGIGLIEGIAEATATLFRAVFGTLSDRLRQRKRFVGGGYSLANIVKPLFYLATSWTHVLGLRFLDRLGKAMRSPARDALLAASVPAETRGRSFGFHRAMDRLGALMGPLCAFAILSWPNQTLRHVFLWAVIPAVLSLVFIPFVKEIKPAPGQNQTPKKQGRFWHSRPFLIFLGVSVLFTLGNGSNAFLLLKASEVGIPDLQLPLLWAVYNAVAIFSSYYIGRMSDRLGRKPIVAISFFYYALIYAAFAWAQTTWVVWGLFGAYGIYYGLSSGIFRAYLADLVPDEERATAYGWFNTATGLALLPASLLMGLIWEHVNSQLAFLVASGLVLVAGILFGLASRPVQQQR